MGNRLIFLYHQIRVITDGGTQKGRPSADWKWRFKLVGGEVGKSASYQPREVMRSPSGHKLVEPMLPRKASREFIW